MSSKIVPVEVQTGCSKGWRDRAQKLKGSRLNDAWVVPAFLESETPAPALAEKLSAEDHSGGYALVLLSMRLQSTRAQRCDWR